MLNNFWCFQILHFSPFFSNCSPYSYRSSNFAIAIVVALHVVLLNFLFWSLLHFCVGALLLFWIFLSLFIALPTIALPTITLSRKQKVKKNSSLSPFRASKIYNYRYRNIWKSGKFPESNTEKKQRTNTKMKQ